jgi:hypothetical protein
LLKSQSVRVHSVTMLTTCQQAGHVNCNTRTSRSCGAPASIHRVRCIPPWMGCRRQVIQTTICAWDSYGLLTHALHLLPRQPRHGCSAGILALNATHNDDQTEFVFAVTDIGGVIVWQDGEILKCVRVTEFLLNNSRRCAHRRKLRLGRLAHKAHRQSRTGERNALRDPHDTHSPGGLGGTPCPDSVGSPNCNSEHTRR